MHPRKTKLSRNLASYDVQVKVEAEEEVEGEDAGQDGESLEPRGTKDDLLPALNSKRLLMGTVTSSRATRVTKTRASRRKRALKRAREAKRQSLPLTKTLLSHRRDAVGADRSETNQAVAKDPKGRRAPTAKPERIRSRSSLDLLLLMMPHPSTTI